MLCKESSWTEQRVRTQKNCGMILTSDSVKKLGSVAVVLLDIEIATTNDDLPKYVLVFLTDRSALNVFTLPKCIYQYTFTNTAYKATEFLRKQHYLSKIS